jgi:hypothetical protein
MKIILLTLTGFFCFAYVEAQKLYKPKKNRNDFFGKAENPRDGKVRPLGFQAQIGPTYTFTHRKNETYQSNADSANRYQLTRDPNGKIGFFAEVGLVRFNVKDAKYSFGRIIDYIDFGIGFKLINGLETTTVTHFDALGKSSYTDIGEGKFSKGYLYGRFAVHKLQYLNNTKNIFLDHSLGINGDYSMLEKSTYTPPYFGPQVFSPIMRAQLHYDLGFGIRLKKGRYLVPGLQLPVLGIQEWNNGSAKLQWFSSKYYPVMFHIKYIHLFPAKKSKHACFEGSAEDRKRNEEYMQNR